MFNARTLARAASLAFALTSIPAAAAPQTTWPTREFFLNQWGGVARCTVSAATDTDVEWCAGDLPPSSPANPARFDCRKAEVLSEYQFCRKPLPRRR